jgi:Ca-activated chloride channel family protein
MRILLVACLFVFAAAPQNAPTFRAERELVTIPCAVVNSHGDAVGNLSREDFRVFDNDVPRIVEYLWRDSDEPLTLGVLVDASDSQRELRAEHFQTARDLLKRILRPGDQAFLISIDENVQLLHNLTLNAAQPFGEPCPKTHGISVCGASPIWNAVYETARLKLRSMKGNKAILLLTDGFDSGSTHTWNQAAAEAQRAEAAVYAIQYPTSEGRSYAPQLYRLVAETGGAWFSPPGSDYAAILSRLETDLRRRYVLGFRPEKLSFNKPRHEVRVETTRPDLTVRARKTYFQ